MNALAVLERSHKGPLYFRPKVEETKEVTTEREENETQGAERYMRGKGR